MDILVCASRDGRASASVVGAMTGAFVSPVSDRSFMGIRFRPGEAHAFLDLRADDATDLVLTPHEAGAKALAELEGAVTPASLVDPRATFDHWLLSRLSRVRAADARVRHAVALVSHCQGRVKAAALAERVGVSDRQLERIFAERVGISPKVLARVVRLQSVVARVDSVVAPRIPWADLAARFGYADQAHLVREVRALTGVSPSELARERRVDLSARAD